MIWLEQYIWYIRWFCFKLTMSRSTLKPLHIISRGLGWAFRTLKGRSDTKSNIANTKSKISLLNIWQREKVAFYLSRLYVGFRECFPFSRLFRIIKLITYNFLCVLISFVLLRCSSVCDICREIWTGCDLGRQLWFLQFGEVAMKSFVPLEILRLRTQRTSTW